MVDIRREVSRGMVGERVIEQTEYEGGDFVLDSERHRKPVKNCTSNAPGVSSAGLRISLTGSPPLAEEDKLSTVPWSTRRQQAGA